MKMLFAVVPGQDIFTDLQAGVISYSEAAFVVAALVISGLIGLGFAMKAARKAT